MQGRVALITGSSRGIGAGIVLALTQAGADIAINYQSNVDAANAVTDTLLRCLICHPRPTPRMRHIVGGKGGTQ
jgi:NAD(P)-dependent dehydrogenase (short-subunit alcohol dehydrogenase family)